MTTFRREMTGLVIEVKPVDTRIHATIAVASGSQTASDLVLEVTQEEADRLSRAGASRSLVRVTVEVQA